MKILIGEPSESGELVERLFKSPVKSAQMIELQGLMTGVRMFEFARFESSLPCFQDRFL